PRRSELTRVRTALRHRRGAGVQLSSPAVRLAHDGQSMARWRPALASSHRLPDSRLGREAHQSVPSHPAKREHMGAEVSELTFQELEVDRDQVGVDHDFDDWDRHANPKIDVIVPPADKNEWPASSSLRHNRAAGAKHGKD